MDVVNRILMSLFALILFVFGAMTFLLLTGIVIPSNPYLRAILALYMAWRTLALLRGASTNIAVLIAFGLLLVGLILLVLELLPIGTLLRRRSEEKKYLVRQDTLGQVTVQRSMVSEVVQHVAGTVPGVTRAAATVKDGADGLHIATSTSLAWDADAPSVGHLLQERIKEAVQTQLGLPVADVRVTVERTPVVNEQHRRVA